MQERPKGEAAKVPVKHEIQLSDSIPVPIPPRRVPHSQTEEIERQIESLKEKGYVEKSQSPYSAPIVPVLKKDGSLRMCIDYRQLNAKTIPSVYPISRSDDILDSLNGSKVFSVLDLKEAYHQIAIKEEDKHKTAFAVPWEKLQWSRMPFGLVGAPYSLAACMNYALESCRLFAKGYYDDIIVYSADMETHLVHLARVLNCLAECGLQVNYKKCDFAREEVNFVGHIVSGNGVKPASAKVSDILNFPVPLSIDSLRTFLGMASYYRKFVEDFSTRAVPLHALLKKGTPFDWSPECQEAFDFIKEKLANANILVYPDFSKPFALQTDASNAGIGFVLCQEHESVLRPIFFGGRVLSETEKRYSVTDKELLTIYFAVKKCEIYLLGHSFTVYTDHKPLSYLKDFKDIVNRGFRWISYLEEMGANVQYISGKENVIADFLSRNVEKLQERTNDVKMSGLQLEFLKYDVSDLLSAQLEDPDIQKVNEILGQSDTGLKEIPKSYRADRQKLFVDEDKLLKYRHHSNVLIVVPEHLRNEILSLCHNKWTSGHFGVFKTHKRVLNLFWWPGLYNDVTQYINNCDICLRVKRLGRVPGRMGIREWPNKPLELISIDYLVDLPQTSRRNKHILVINDHFSKFIQVYAVKDKTALTASRYVLDYCLRFGFPLRLLSDQDPAYESELFQHLMLALGVDKIRTSGYNPRSNGLTEQSNAVTKDYLRAYVLESNQLRLDWDCWTRELGFAYNTSVHSSTGFTPVELMFGRKFRVPMDMLFGALYGHENAPRSVEEFHEQLSGMYTLVKRNLEARQKVTATYYDQKVKDDKLLPGTLVYVYLSAKKREKLSIKWAGPFKVISESHPVYKVEIVAEKGSYVKVLTRDKLRRAGENAKVITYARDTKEEQTTESVHPEKEMESDSDSDEERLIDPVNIAVNEDDVEPEAHEGLRGRGRYNLRPNPEVRQNRYERYFTHFLAII